MSDNEARQPGEGRSWYPAPKEGPAVSTKMRDQVLRHQRKQKGANILLRTTLTYPELRPVGKAARVIGIRCSVLAEAVQQKDARNLQMACDPDQEMLRLHIIRLCVIMNKTIHYSTNI